MFKRTISMFLVCSLALTPVGSFAENEAPAFPQATQSANTLKALNLIQGDSKGLRLNDQLNRAEALVLIVKLLGDQDQLEPVRLTAYKDVKSTDWFAPYVAYANKNGIASGISKDQFAPNASVTEKQFLKMLLSAMQYEMGKDFTWESVEQFAASKGYPVSSKSEQVKKDITANFNRSGAFDMTFAALKQTSKNEKATILEKLVTSGKIELKALENPVVTTGIDQKLIETIKTNIAPKATSTTALPTVPTTPPVPTTTAVSSAPSGGYSGGSSPSTSTSASTSSTPVNPVLPAKEVSLVDYKVGANTIDLFFSEELDAKTAEMTGVVNINNGIKIISATYKKGEKRLHIKRDTCKLNNTYKVTVDPSGLKTEKGNPVTMAHNFLYFNGIYDDPIYTDNNPTEFMLYIHNDYKLEQLTDISQISVVRTDTNETLPVTSYEFNTKEQSVKLFTNQIPKNTPFTISLSQIKLYSEDEQLSNYVIHYKSRAYTPPAIEKAEFSDKNLLNKNCLDVYFNLSITETVLRDLNNYKLYKDSVSPNTLLKLSGIMGYSHNKVLLGLDGLNIDSKSDYILIIENLTSEYEKVKSDGPITFTIKGTGKKAPVIKRSSYNDDRHLALYFNENILNSELSNISNYKLYKESISPLNEIKIDQVSAGYEQYTNRVVLTLPELKDDMPLVLVISNMISQEEVKSESPIEYPFYSPAHYSSVRISNLDFTAEKAVYLKFNGKMDNATALDAQNYRLADGTDDSLVNISSITYDEANDLYILKPENDTFLSFNELLLEVDTSKLKDFSGKPLSDVDGAYSLDASSMKEPLKINYVTMTSSSSITFGANKELKTKSVSNVDHYVIKDSEGNVIPVIAANIDSDSFMVTLKVPPQFKQNAKYTLTIKTLEALSNHTLQEPVTLEFTGME